MDRLPTEIIIWILSRLPITYLMQAKSVCRAWRNMIQDPLLASEHFSYMADNDPSFILQSQSRANYHLFFTYFSHDSQGNLISKKPPTPAMMMSLVDSCNGLLVCMSDVRDIYICNPFIGVSIELPKVVNPSAQVGHLEFGFNPTTKEYKLVRIKPLRKRDAPTNVNRSNSERCSEVHVLTLGNPAWRNLGVIPHCFARRASKVLVNKRLHWLSRPNRHSLLIISFDLETEQFQEVPKPNFCDIDEGLRHLMVLWGCLSVAIYQNKELEVWVMKEYGVKESWIKEFNIGTYLPSTLRQPKFGGPRNHYSRVPFPNSCVQVICSLKSGEILLAYGSRSLVLYDPQHGTFKELAFPEMPDWFKIIVHVGSLSWIDTPINI